MLNDNIDLNPQFYRSVNDLPFLKHYSKKTEEIQKSVSKLITLPTYSDIDKNYLNKIIVSINKYK